jgi:hypothetical protein
MHLIILILKCVECLMLSGIFRWSLRCSSGFGYNVHRLCACLLYLLSFFLFLFKTIGHVTQSTGVELLIIRTVTAHPSFNRCAANESTFFSLVTCADFLILPSQMFNDDYFNKTFVVRVAFIQIMPAFKKKCFLPSYDLVILSFNRLRR